ncbi:c-type cytochrome [Celeribacter indicus]|uniref:Class I triheme cytochrome c n=1 Tax=Celeribacter indicus TaxID=1208324 RepID=A0A0B5DX54_9RHOB|nr:cytochrome c [Celeribacter indicus]AJE47599.1 Class I triheme cytochrome c [Celeribacter indicus]SDW11475.1 Cytochrome c, mono-and diheme variants [Celeribacter indicus]
MGRSFGTGIAAGILATLLAALAVWLMVTYTGAYDVSARDAHTDAVRWTFDTTLHRSVASRAEGIELPERSSQDLIAEGAGHYAESCVHCHGAPGEEPAGWSRGMRPEPPRLAEVAADWSAEEIYWIVENGLKMTGMPAFGPDHDGGELLALAAFVSALPGLSAQDYATLTRRDGAGAALPGPAPTDEN